LNLYREEIIDHYKNPRNKGSLKNPDITVSENNITCGDEVTISIKLQDTKNKMQMNKIEFIAFTGEGCAISIASASMLTEKLEGKSLEEVKNVSDKDILDMLKIDISPGRLKCAMLPLEALRNIGIAKPQK